jgi:hypothetical protein
MRSLLLLTVGISLVGGFSSCVAPATKLPPPEGTIRAGSLANQKLLRDTTAGAFKALQAKGYDMLGDHHIQPYVVSLPSGQPGSRKWTERWYVAVKGRKIPMTIHFKESGTGAADFTIKIHPQ